MEINCGRVFHEEIDSNCCDPCALRGCGCFYLARGADTLRGRPASVRRKRASSRRDLRNRKGSPSPAPRKAREDGEKHDPESGSGTKKRGEKIHEGRTQGGKTRAEQLTPHEIASSLLLCLSVMTWRGM